LSECFLFCALLLGSYIFLDNRRFEVNPFAIAFPTSTEQVSTIVKAGAKHNLGVVARSGGVSFPSFSRLFLFEANSSGKRQHSYIANGLGGTNGSLVVDLSQMKGITIDSETYNAQIETGNRLGDIALALNEKGRGLPHGRCSYIGIGGHSGELVLPFLLRECLLKETPGYGGWGFASRMWGLTLDNILSATVVLANGTVVTVSEDSHSELFWVCATFLSQLCKPVS
jgi:FAD/FMN-containing dehydrogenase